MGFACAVIADDHQSLIVGGSIELEVRNDQRDDLLGHFFRNYIGRNELLGSVGLIRVTELNHTLDWLEMYELAVLHACSSHLQFDPVPSALAAMRSKSRTGYRRYSGWFGRA